MEVISQQIKQNISAGNDMQASLLVRDVCFAYPARSMFWQLNFSAGAGITWLRGNNGSGKTTLLKLLSGVLDPQKDRFLVLV